MNAKIKHDKKYQQFTIEFEGDDAELAYATPSEGILDFTHTYVPESARGKGIAQKLIAHGLQYASDHHFKVIASCPIVARYIDQHEEYQKLLSI